MEKLIVIIIISLCLISCYYGLYIEKSYKFVNHEITDGGFDGDCVIDTISDDEVYQVYFSWGEMKFYLTHRILEGPYRVRFTFINNNLIKKVIINDIILKYNETVESLLKNIYQIKYWDWQNKGVFYDLEKFYSANTIEFDDELNGFYFRLSNIDIPYNKVENIELRFIMSVYLENGEIRNINREYKLIRFKDSHEGSFQ